ncbi:MAG: flagellar M-ring protein FliF [Treponemataceae bacterium]|nr:flagellar M-ring protein FliF [Treponemataceae bacterium]
MNEWIQKVMSQAKTLWAKWSNIQKAILVGIVVVVIGALVMVGRVSSGPDEEPLFNTTFEESVLTNIQVRLDTEGVEYRTVNGIIYVKNKATARRMKSILVREDIIPTTTDPWAIFDVDRWTTSDFLNDVNKRRAIIGEVEQAIKAFDDVDDAKVSIDIPEQTLFVSDQRVPTATVVLTTKPGSDLAKNRKKIEGIQKLVRFAYSSLTDENIAILDSTTGVQLNNFDDMRDIEKVDIYTRQQKFITNLQNEYRIKILNSLQQIFTSDRVRDLDIKIEMDMSEKTVQSTEYSPIIINEDNPDTPYDDSLKREYLPISSETVTKVTKGTVYNPEGPAGVEGQNPPVYSDMSNAYTVTEERGEKVNNVMNESHTQEIKAPTIDRVTVSVAVDGTWTKKRKDNGELDIQKGEIQREYHEVSAEDLAKAERLIQNAIGYNRNRGDSVTIENIRFDRTVQFEEEDALELRKSQTQRTIIYAATGIAAVLLAFIIFRMISRELERKRRQKEEEILRQHQMEREKTLWEAEQAGMEVTMSVEERERAELQENAIALAKEHPEDVAMLLRTWLMEE